MKQPYTIHTIDNLDNGSLEYISLKEAIKDLYVCFDGVKKPALYDFPIEADIDAETLRVYQESALVRMPLEPLENIEFVISAKIKGKHVKYIIPRVLEILACYPDHDGMFIDSTITYAVDLNNEQEIKRNFIWQPNEIACFQNYFTSVITFYLSIRSNNAIYLTRLAIEQLGLEYIYQNVFVDASIDTVMFYFNEMVDTVKIEEMLQYDFELMQILYQHIKNSNTPLHPLYETYMTNLLNEENEFEKTTQ